jgi:hypothetical protein
LQVSDRQLQVLRSTTALRSMCMAVEEAMLRLSRGEQVLVAGSDVVEIRRRVDAELREA